MSLPSHWYLEVVRGAETEEVSEINLYCVGRQVLSDSDPIVVTRSLIVKQDLSHVNGHRVNCCSAFPATPTTVSVEKLISLLFELETCPGQPDPKFVEMVSQKKGNVLSVDKGVVAYLDKS